MTGIPRIDWTEYLQDRTLVGQPVPEVEPERLPPEWDIMLDGQHLISCRTVPDYLARAVVREYEQVPRSAVQRGGGILAAANTFGMAAPSNILQRVTPALTAWSRDYPDQAVTDFAEWAWPQLPVPQTTHGIHPDYRIGDTGWTSGIGNDTSPLHYHLDANNVADAWSGMLCARAATEGGHLHFPEYGKAVPVNDRSLLMFPGVNNVHGVTPITRRLPGGFRYTFVFYPVRAFQGKGPLADEIKATQERRTTLEAAPSAAKLAMQRKQQ